MTFAAAPTVGCQDLSKGQWHPESCLSPKWRASDPSSDPLERIVGRAFALSFSDESSSQCNIASSPAVSGVLCPITSFVTSLRRCSPARAPFTAAGLFLYSFLYNSLRLVNGPEGCIHVINLSFLDYVTLTCRSRARTHGSNPSLRPCHPTPRRICRPAGHGSHDSAMGGWQATPGERSFLSAKRPSFGHLPMGEQRGHSGFWNGR